jgi:hypothetical protein
LEIDMTYEANLALLQRLQANYLKLSAMAFDQGDIKTAHLFQDCADRTAIRITVLWAEHNEVHA